MAHAFFLGVDVDLADNGDLSGVTHAIFEKETEGTSDEGTYRLDYIRRHSDVTGADAFADYLQGLVAKQPYIGRTSLVVNQNTDFGRALVEALEERGLDPVAATVTEGSGRAAGDPDEMGVHLGGIDLVRTIGDLYWEGRVSVEGVTSESASRLARDLQALAEQIDEADGDLEALGTSTAGPSYDPAATHVTSAALAVWLGTERSFDPSQHLKESPQTEASVEGPENRT